MLYKAISKLKSINSNLISKSFSPARWIAEQIPGFKLSKWVAKIDEVFPVVTTGLDEYYDAPNDTMMDLVFNCVFYPIIFLPTVIGKLLDILLGYGFDLKFKSGFGFDNQGRMASYSNVGPFASLFYTLSSVPAFLCAVPSALIPPILFVALYSAAIVLDLTVDAIMAVSSFIGAATALVVDSLAIVVSVVAAMIVGVADLVIEAIVKPVSELWQKLLTCFKKTPSIQETSVTNNSILSESTSEAAKLLGLSANNLMNDNAEHIKKDAGVSVEANFSIDKKGIQVSPEIENTSVNTPTL